MRTRAPLVRRSAKSLTEDEMLTKRCLASSAKRSIISTIPRTFPELGVVIIYNKIVVGCDREVIFYSRRKDTTELKRSRGVFESKK